MPTIKSVSSIADKWARVTPQRAQDYAAGVRSPKNSWAEGAAAAAEAYAEGVQQAISDSRFEKGVRAAGDAKWQRKASSVGAQRFGPGVQAAKSDYQAGFAPYASVIESTTLPPRGPKGDPRNYVRAQEMGEALHSAKVGGSGSE